MKITLEGFRGAIPQLPPLSLPPSHAQEAESLRADEGYLRPLLAAVPWVRDPLPKAGDLKALYRYKAEPGDPASGYLFHWTAPTQVAAGFIRGDTQRAVAFTTEGDRPRITDATIATASANQPSQSYWLGVPAPSSAPIAALDIGFNNHSVVTTDGANWSEGAAAADNSWRGLCYSPELDLYVAVATTGANNRVMTSPDGETWTARTSAANNNWVSVCWSPELMLFVAVANSGVGNRVMTSPDGETWTARASAADNDWRSVCWASALGLFVAVASSGNGNRVMTSADGVTWTIRTSAANNEWRSVCWSPALGRLVAVASSGSGNRVMTSADGVTWTIRTSAANNAWQAVCWSPDLALFCAVANTGSGDRVMTSPDGIAWTIRTSADDSAWAALTWSPTLALFFAVATDGDSRLMVSADGQTWSVRSTGDSTERSWYAILWADGQLVGLATTDAGDDDDRVERNYVLIYESYWTTQRFEGPPAQDADGNILFSNSVSPLPDQPVVLGNLPAAPTGSWNVTHVGIFRLSGSVYRRVGRVVVGTTTFIDNIIEEALGEVLPSADFHPPADDMHHIGVLANGIGYGAVGTEVALSYPYLIHAWGPNNRVPLGEAVMATVHLDSTIYAITRKNPFIITGNDPRSMYSQELEIGQGCMSAQSVCVTRYGVAYASAEGLILLTPDGDHRNLVEGFLLPEQWRAYKPESMLCGVHEDWLLCFWDSGVDEGCLVFRLDQGDFGIVTLPGLQATAVYADPLLDTLVLALPYDGIAQQLRLFQGGDTPDTNYRWKSGLLKPPAPTALTAGRVWSRDYSRPLTLRLYNEAGDLLHTQVVTSERAFRLPGDYRAMGFVVELEGTQEVMRVELARTMTELRDE